MRHDGKKIVVTQQHIEVGMPENSSKCMVSEAVKDAFPGAKKAHTDMQTIRFTDKHGIRRTWLTPASVQAALVRFDAGDLVKPFSFFLRQPIHLSKRPAQGGKLPMEGMPKYRGVHPPVRVGGRPVVMLGNATRRRFGIRNLRINQEGKVEQIGTEA